MKTVFYSWITGILGGGIQGAALLLASLLTFFHLSADPTYYQPLLGSRWATCLLAEFELCLGAWLLSGFMPQWARLTAMTCFLLFCTVNLVYLIQGSPSCGCFGKVEIHPAIMLVFDLVCLAGLWAWRPSPNHANPPWRLPACMAFVGAFSAAGLIAVTWVNSSTFELAEANAAGAKIVVIEPDKWIGKAVPLIDYLETGSHPDLTAGDWLILLHNPACGECREFVAALGNSANESRGPIGMGLRIALVEVPVPDRGGAAEDIGTPDGFVLACLRRDITWFAQTPVAIRVQSGTVVGVTHLAEEALNWIAAASPGFKR